MLSFHHFSRTTIGEVCSGACVVGTQEKRGPRGIARVYHCWVKGVFRKSWSMISYAYLWYPVLGKLQLQGGWLAVCLLYCLRVLASRTCVFDSHGCDRPWVSCLSRFALQTPAINRGVLPQGTQVMPSVQQWLIPGTWYRAVYLLEEEHV